MIATDGIPEAWPALLSRDQLRAYSGNLSDDTLRKICPVPAVDLGANVLRYRRSEVDAWLASLAHRGLRAQPDDAQDSPQIANDRPSAAVERARARAAARGR